MFEKYFFDIPVFRCNLNKFGEEKSAQVIKVSKQIAGHSEVTEEHTRLAEDWLASKFSSFRYSEMVGVIRLYAMPGQIRAEVYFVKNKRLSINQKNKQWGYIGKLFEFGTFKHDSNNDIYRRILSKIREYNDEGYLKKRFIDLEAFSVSGPYINYRELTNL